MMHLIVPMAGLGQRFRDEGYALPKPLIDVSGMPMVVRAVRDLPPCERMTFLVHPDHVRKHAIDRRLRDYFPQAAVIATPGLTAGQACTVRLASTAVDDDEEVLVAACDNTPVYDAAKFAVLRADPTIDAMIWTYRHDPRVLVKPTAHGWVQLFENPLPPGEGGSRSEPGEGTPRVVEGKSSHPHPGPLPEGEGEVARISCKRPISDAPMSDHAISGCFWFRRAGDLFRAIDELVASNQRVNNEFYLDQVPNLFVQSGRRVVVFEMEKYIGWGTPQDLADYQAWERYFQSRSRLPRGTWRAA
jgi:bifunctional N-acetylglucosamine-1-phosphate-uridyltransferase/glucosamine-1-phosphate-acetyltransferase GlmU-like protein